jgi:putative ABC transport system ATP-binding protein
VRDRTTTDILLGAEELRGDHFGPISLRLSAAECVIVQGPSGAGKTLLLRALADMDPSYGDVWLAGVPREKIPGPDWRRQVAILPAESHWWAETVHEHLATEPSQELLAVGFDADVLRWPVSRLSSGERQRLSLVRLLANRPRVLLLDEPTANLDSGNTDKVESLVASYRQLHHAAVVWVSHDVQQAARVATRVMCLDGGRITREDTACAAP